MLETLSYSTKLTGLAAAAGVRTYIGTLDVQITHYETASEPSQADFSQPVILAFWHEYILVPFALWGHCEIAVLASQHRDADWLVSMGHFLGYKVVRGSTTRGGASALRELKRLSKTTTLVITPDGPKGPRREMSLGPIFLASRLGLPIVPSGLGYDRPWRLNSWDRFALPRPGSRARILVGPKMFLPPKLDRAGLEHYRQQVDDLLHYLTAEAESWAASGKRLPRQRRFSLGGMGRRIDPPHATLPHAAAPIAPHFLEAAHETARRSRRAG